MSLITVTSPHLHRPLSTGEVMRAVIIATLPGLAALTWFFGWGNLINIVWASLLAIGLETLMLRLRGRPVAFFLKDNSALVTAILLGLALPPTTPFWVTAVAMLFAIVIAKHLYGGLGSNPFNPAMVGYVVVLISFPKQMTAWLPAQSIDGVSALGFLDSLSLIFTGQVADRGVDAFTLATPLDTFRIYHGQFEKLADMQVMKGQWAGVGWEWINLGFLLGGCYLLARRLITWHIPVSMLAAMGLLALPFYAADPHNYGSPLFHWFSGGAMLGAFFIATDPVTAATSARGKLIFGAGIGVLVYVIRTFGGYPDAVAFSVLIMNIAAPMLDYYTQPRTYGHGAPRRGLPPKHDATKQ
jgi:electron transport complex protein RnfD